MGTAVANRFDAQMAEFKRQLTSMMPKIRACVPSHVKPNQLIRTLFSAVEANPAILQCSSESLGRCVMQAATYGLEINSGQLGHAYIVPYRDTAQLQLSYKGLKELVRRSGEGIVVMGEVREGDTFVIPSSKMCDVEHIEANDPKRHEKKLTHAYAVMHFTSGLKINCVWSREKCISHRDRYSKSHARYVSKGKEKESPWFEGNDAFPKMCQKTCVHSMANDGDLPLSAEVRALLEDKDAQPETVDAVVVEPQSITDQTPEEDEPIPVDWKYVEDKLNTITTEKPLDDFQREMELTHPEERQAIFDRCNEHLELIRETAK